MMFFILFFELISISLVTIGFFLGFETTKNNVLIYLLIIGCIIFLGIIVYCLYSLFCKTFYEFTKNSIRILKNGIMIKEINFNKITYCKYYTFMALLFGDSKGGNLVINYLEDNEEKYIEISFLKKLTKKINSTIYL